MKRYRILNQGSWGTLKMQYFLLTRLASLMAVSGYLRCSRISRFRVKSNWLFLNLSLVASMVWNLAVEFLSFACLTVAGFRSIPVIFRIGLSFNSLEMTMPSPQPMSRILLALL